MKLSINQHFKSSRYAKGAYAEKSLVNALRKVGYKVTHHRLGGTDITAVSPNGTITRIECKYASQGKDGKYRATTIKKNCTDHRKSDVIVMLCHSKYTGGELTAFIIPCEKQGDKPHIAITSNPKTYSGKYAEFRENWSILE